MIQKIHSTDLDEDPFLIDSWEEYCRTCLKASRIDLFKKKLSEYVYMTNRPLQAELEAYIEFRSAEIRLQEASESDPMMKRIFKKGVRR